MGDGFPCQDRVVAALGQLALVKALRFRLKTHGKLRCFPRRPPHIPMAIFDIALAFALAIAQFGTVHTAAIGSRVPNGGEASDMAGFQRDCLRYNRPNAIDCQQLLLRGRVFQPLADGLFHRFARLAQTRKDGQAAGDGQHVIGLRKQVPELCGGSLAHPLDTATRPRIAHHDVVHTEHMRGVLTNEVGAFA